MFYPDEAKLSKPLIFDSHAHYDDEKFDDYRPELLNELNKSGVKYAITCSVDGDSSESSLRIAEEYDFIYAAVGIHPENISSNTSLLKIESLAKHQKCVAIGEIGLDYYYDDSNKSEQISVFENQIILANKLDLPIIVHDREAHFDTLKLLKKYKPKGVVHCFSGSAEMAKDILDIGMYIGIGGVITFKNSKKLPEVLKMLPDDRLLLETDCPYLSPEPYRGKINHSGFITFTAKKIAELKHTDFESVLEQSSENAQRLFGIK